MVITDQSLYCSLTRMRRAFDGLLATPLLLKRSSLDSLTPAEVELEAQWQQELEPVLTDLYWYPFRNGLSEAPVDEQELRQWLKKKLDSGVAVAVLLALLLRYLRRGVNVGGRMAFDLLGIGGTFHLTNSAYLRILDAHAATLTSSDTNLSLIDTTVDNLTAGIQAARQSDDPSAMGHPLSALGDMISSWASVRSVWIAATEESRMVARGLNWTYRKNGVAQQVYRVRETACPICSPLEGSVMPVDNIPFELEIPQHVACRCWYEAVTDGWQQPAQIWRGE